MPLVPGTIQIKYGLLEANLPLLLNGQLAFCEDTRRMWIGTNFGNYPIACGCEDLESSVPASSSSMSSPSSATSASSLSSASSLVDVSSSSNSSSSESRSGSSSSSFSGSYSSLSDSPSSASSLSGACFDIVDTFTDANMELVDHVSETGHRWTDIFKQTGFAGSWYINSNKAKHSGANPFYNTFALLYANNVDGSIEFDITTPDVGTFLCAVVGRCDSPTIAALNGWAFKITNDGSGSGLCAITNGVFSAILASSATTFAYNTTYKIRLSLEGTALKGYVNGVQDWTKTQASSYAGTYWGMGEHFTSSGHVLFDNCLFLCGGALEMSSSSSTSSSKSSSSSTSASTSSASSSSASSESSSTPSSLSSNGSSSSSASSASSDSSASSNSSSSSSSSTASSSSSSSSASSSSSNSSSSSSVNSSSSSSSKSMSSSSSSGGVTYLFHDTFTDTDGTYLDAHTPDTGTYTYLSAGSYWTITSNAVEVTSGPFATAYTEVGVADITVEVDFTTPATDEWVIIPTGRAQANTALNGYYYSNYSGGIYNGIWEDDVQLTTSSPDLSAGPHTLKLVYSGTTVTVYLDGVQIDTTTLSVTHATHTYSGFQGYINVAPWIAMPIDELRIY